MRKKVNLFSMMKTIITMEDCCMGCMLDKLYYLVNMDTSCDKEIKDKLLSIINDNEMPDRAKILLLEEFISERN